MNRPIRAPMSVAAVTVAAALLAMPIAAATPPAGPTVLAIDQFALADHTGKVVLLDFWASWCKPCRKAMPWLSGLQRKYGDEGFQVVAVNVDRKAASAQAMIAEIDPAVLVVLDPDGELAEKYELKGMPSTFLIDRDGKLAASHLGFLEADAPEREAEVAALLKKAPGKDPR